MARVTVVNAIADRYSQEVQRFDDLLSGDNVYTTEEVLDEVLAKGFALENPLRPMWGRMISGAAVANRRPSRLSVS